MKKIVGIAIAAFFGFGIYDSSAKAETVVTTDVLNVREEPTVESTVVGKVLKGHELHVVNTENGWSQIKWNGKDVFVSALFTKKYVLCNCKCIERTCRNECEFRNSRYAKER